MKRRWVATLGGLILMLVGAVTVLVSFASYAACTSLVSERSFRLRSPGIAVTVSSAVLDAERFWVGTDLLCGADFDRLTVRVAARPAGGKPVFVGVAPAVAVERYLGASWHTPVAALDLSGVYDGPRYRRDRHVGGEASRIGRPEPLTFWETHGRSTPGGPARLTRSWRAPAYFEPEQVFRLVLMNVDGSRQVAADTTFTWAVAGHTTWPFLVASFGFAVISAGIFVVAKQPRRRAAGIR